MFIVEVEDRAAGHLHAGASADEYIEALLLQVQILTELRDAGLTLHHRGSGSFWFTTSDAKLAAKYGGREGTFELEAEGANIEGFLADAER